MEETRIGDGSILTGLATLVCALTFLAAVVMIGAGWLLAVWRGYEPPAWVQWAWEWVAKFWKGKSNG